MVWKRPKTTGIFARNDPAQAAARFEADLLAEGEELGSNLLRVDQGGEK
jgi:hypothetical protein